LFHVKPQGGPAREVFLWVNLWIQAWSYPQLGPRRLGGCADAPRRRCAPLVDDHRRRRRRRLRRGVVDVAAPRHESLAGRNAAGLLRAAWIARLGAPYRIRHGMRRAVAGVVCHADVSGAAALALDCHGNDAFR